ncbi:MAG: tRNA uridine(34) 5-carboxymethylaminomethyl modification radical SAM/GNAT enzyme Elp3 [Pseudomonadales bacterium]|jgi:elongator complex protein 3|nr:tRNA uridine(34) 5-carboxymethylaminomethyl modification radical SAM/GNAT enzyme Elp3 [Pseudomonadales bacterium]
MTAENKQSQNLQALIKKLFGVLRADGEISSVKVGQIMRQFPKDETSAQPFFNKSEILAYYNKNKSIFFENGEIDKKLDFKVKQALLVKPIRTQSGVATVTVLTKPWTCPGQCIFCPSDIRMPKSYLVDEPGAQRAEINYFDPYLQVASRLQNLAQMGHNLNKIELIVLGGTWHDYPLVYQHWFISELFRALNDFEVGNLIKLNFEMEKRQESYEKINKESEIVGELHLTKDRNINQKNWHKAQEEINQGEAVYNKQVEKLYLQSLNYEEQTKFQRADLKDLKHVQKINETAAARCVGLVIETRPDMISIENLKLLRAHGCTKVQIGVQSVNDEILRQNGRGITAERIAESFALLRLFGFKIHGHFMANLLGANPDLDIADYREFVTNEKYLPDEVKVYPCSLIESATLMNFYLKKLWQPYSEKELMRVLVANLLATPAYMRITRMIRDISSDDIVVGNKKTNFRQMVEAEIKKQGGEIREIRNREIKNSSLDGEEIELQEIIYDTVVSQEIFLQFVTEKTKKLVGFLRLSLPKESEFFGKINNDELSAKNAMIREIHVYGQVAKWGDRTNSQHLGIGSKLIKRAIAISKENNYKKLNVISAVGTREYYRKQGFADGEMYQYLEI